MIKGGVGGGNTRTGLVFEGNTDLATFLSQQNGYEVKNKTDVFFNGELVANIYKKHSFYKFLTNKGINWKVYVSHQILPDDSIYVIINNTMYIIECKYQQRSGSVDEKLQTCVFKKKQYKKLLSRLNIEVQYIYLLSDWFKNPIYKDVLDYIINVGCQFYFDYIPLQKLGLPVPNNT